MHMSPGHAVCLYADALENHRSTIFMQALQNQLNIESERKKHEPLAFASGKVSVHQAR